MTPRKRVGVLISGRGSNLAALIEAARAPDYPAEIVAVVSNRPGAPGLAHAAAAGIATHTVDHKAYRKRAAFEADMQAVLTGARVDLLCNAGFMRLLTAEFVEAWRDRHLNIHPSLLPAFRGLDTHARVLAAGARITGCTVHFVRAEMDAGPIVAQAAVAVAADDKPESLAARVLEAEHLLYPHAVALVASGAARVVGETVHIDPADWPRRALFSPALESEFGDIVDC